MFFVHEAGWLAGWRVGGRAGGKQNADKMRVNLNS